MREWFETVAAFAAALVGMGVIFRYLVRAPFNYFKRLESVINRVETQTNGQLAARFDDLTAQVSDLRDKVDLVLAAHRDPSPRRSANLHTTDL